MNINKVNKLNKMEDIFVDKYCFLDFQPKYIKDEELRVKQIAYYLANSKKVVAITGAGISTASGIPDFRSNDGIYSTSPERIFSKENFNSNPEELINLLIKVFNNSFEINYGHAFLKKIEEDKDVSIITQNIDGLHEKANSKDIINIHGSINTALCNNCGNIYEMLWERTNLSIKDFTCDCENVLKPDIVLYGENVKDLNKAITKVEEADLILILGSSLMVEPVASLPLNAHFKTPIVIINKDSTPLDNNNNTIVINDDICNTLRKINDLIY